MAQASITDLDTATADPDATDQLLIKDAAGNVGPAVVAAFIKNGMLAADAITAAKVADDAVGSNALGAGAVTAAKIAADQITADKLETQAGVTAGTFNLPLTSVTIEKGIITAITGA